MSMDDVIQIIAPQPDSQYRLCGCPKCKGDNVAYMQRKTNMVLEGEMWHGKCFDCGYTGDGAVIRHDAQLLWNQKKVVISL